MAPVSESGLMEEPGNRERPAWALGGWLKINPDRDDLRLERSHPSSCVKNTAEAKRVSHALLASRYSHVKRDVCEQQLRCCFCS